MIELKTLGKVVLAGVAITVLFWGIVACVFADVFAQGYTRSDGQYVQPYHRSNPNSSMYDNYSTKGQYNPYTGKAGTVNPYGSSEKSSIGDAIADAIRKEG